MPSSRPRTTLFFDLLKVGQDHCLFFSTAEISRKICDFLRKDLFFQNTCALCPWFSALASIIPVLGLEKVCPPKVGPWSWPRVFLCPWPRALCPRLCLWLPMRVPNFQSMFWSRVVVKDKVRGQNCKIAAFQENV